MCGLAVYSVRKGPIRSYGDLDIKEGDGVVFFLLHGEFDEWMQHMVVPASLLFILIFIVTLILHTMQSFKHHLSVDVVLCLIKNVLSEGGSWEVKSALSSLLLATFRVLLLCI